MSPSNQAIDFIAGQNASIDLGGCSILLFWLTCMEYDLAERSQRDPIAYMV